MLRGPKSLNDEMMKPKKILAVYRIMLIQQKTAASRIIGPFIRWIFFVDRECPFNKIKIS